MRIVHIFLIVFFCFIGSYISASIPLYHFKSYQVEDGLSHNTVWCGMQDSYGFIWLGTSDGLNCYNGKTNKIYRNELNNNYSIPNNYIQTLLELEDTNILVGTNQGLYLYNRQRDHFTPFDKRTEYGVSISSEIKKILRTDNGFLWIATVGQGLFVYNYNTGKLTQNSSFSPFICDIIQAESGEIYLATLQDGLYCFDEGGLLRKKYRLSNEGEEKEDYKINCLLEVDGDIWIGTTGHQLLKLDKQSHSFKTHPLFKDGVEAIQCLTRTSPDDIFIGTDFGLYKFKYKEGTISRLNNQSMSDQAINAIFKDEEGGCWILTNLGGVNYIPKSSKQFHLYSPFRFDAAGAASRVTGPIAEDASGRIWVGTRGGLYVLDPVKQIVAYYTYGMRNDKSHDIRSLLVDDKQIWMGTSGAGLLVMDMTTGRIKTYTHSKDIPNTICSNDVLSIYQVRNGDIYVGTSWGLCRYNEKSDCFITVTAVGMMVSIVDIHEDNSGHLWIATNNGGIFRVNVDTGIWKHYHHQVNDKSSILSNSVITLFEDSQGTMWFGTDGRGICYYDKDTDSFINFDPANKYIGNQVVYAIEEDQAGNFWIATNNGLIRIHPEKKDNLQRFTVNEGLQGNQFNFRSSFKSSAGSLFFGGINGFNMFSPETFTDNDYIPPVYITGINFPYTDEESPEMEDLDLSASLYLSEQLVLPYTHNSFSLDFAALSYEAPANNRYSYILHGVDKDWIQNTDINRAFYTDLPPGKYRFEVRGSNNDGVWNEQSTTLTILITPPWWRSGIAYFLYAILIAGTLFYVGWLWNRHVRKKYRRRMADFETEKEKEIYQSKINFFINLVHEIRTPLSLIKLPLEKLQEDKKEESEQKYLSVIDSNVNYLLNITNQLLDFQKMENGNVNFLFSPVNLRELIQTVVLQVVAPAELKGITLTTETGQKEVISFTDKDKVEKILVNLISNAIKYAASKIRINLTVSGTHYSIAVSDDGPGIPDEEKRKIFNTFYQIENRQNVTGTGLGLSFSKSLAEGINGSLRVENNEWGGATFILSIPVTEILPVPVESPESTVLLQEEQLEEDVATFGLPKQKYSVLLVEDNQDLLKLTAESLGEWFHIVTSTNGKEALIKIEKENPDIIVSDVMMPVMDGLELCRRIKADISISHTPVILLTAKTNLESKVEGFECGADAYVEKPFSGRQLRRQIENLLKMRLAYHKMLQNISGDVEVQTDDTLSQKDYQLITRINNAIEEHLSDEDFTIDILAESLDMSRSKFYRKVKGLTGMTPNEYLRVFRLNKSVVLLKQGIRISDIYHRIGFSSSSYYAKCFKDHFGVLPKEYLEEK